MSKLDRIRRFLENHFTIKLQNDVLWQFFTFKNNGQPLQKFELKGTIFDVEKDMKGFIRSGGSIGVALQKDWRPGFETNKQIYLHIEECEHIRSGPVILIIPAQNLKMEEKSWKLNGKSA